MCFSITCILYTDIQNSNYLIGNINRIQVTQLCTRLDKWVTHITNLVNRLGFSVKPLHS